MLNMKLRIEIWEIKIGLGILLIFVSVFFLLANEFHTGLMIFGIGLIPITLTLASPSSFIHAMKRPTNQKELEEIELIFYLQQ